MSHLLLITSLYPTADRPEVGAFVRRRVEALAARGVEVTVIASDDYRRSALRRHLEIAARALQVEGRFDGVEAHVLFPLGVIGLLTARLRRLPLLVYAHGWDVQVHARRSPLHAWLARRVARGAFAVVTNSQAMADDIRRLGVEPVVIPPGVDLARFRPADRGAARARLGLPADGMVALYLGTFDRRKGADVFAAALAERPAWTGVMVGSGPLQAHLAAAPWLRLVPPVPPDAVPAWLAAADVVVVPSRREPLGLAAIEALACGRPVIASATGGLVEVVRDEVNGLLVAPGDPRAVAGALARLAAPELRLRLGAEGPASVADHDLAVAAGRMAAVWARAGVAA